MARPTRGFSVLFLPLLAFAPGCSSGRAPDLPPGEDLAWPRAAPRVRLERVIEIGREPAVRRIWRGVAGHERQELFRRPYGMAWDGQDLVIADPGAGRIVRVDPSGRVTARISRELESPIGLAVCENGVVATDSATGTVRLLGRELERSRTLATGLDRPTGVVCRGSDVILAETGRHRLLVLRLDTSGGVVERSSIGGRGDGPGEFNFPTSLALTDDSLWVGDTMNFRVQELDADSGEYLGQFGRLGDAPGDMPRIKGLAVDSLGHLWISDAHLDQVWLYRADGTFLMSLGRAGSGAGEFSFPAGIAAEGGRVAVADSLNRRVQVFRELSGQLPAVEPIEETSR